MRRSCSSRQSRSCPQLAGQLPNATLRRPPECFDIPAAGRYESRLLNDNKKSPRVIPIDVGHRRQAPRRPVPQPPSSSEGSGAGSSRERGGEHFVECEHLVLAIGSAGVPCLRMHRCMCTSRSRHPAGEGSEIATAVSQRCAYLSPRDGDGQAQVARSAIAALIIPVPPASPTPPAEGVAPGARLHLPQPALPSVHDRPLRPAHRRWAWELAG